MFRCIFYMLVCVYIRIVEQSQTELKTKDVTYCIINGRFRYFPIFYKFFQMTDKGTTDHFHIDTGINRFQGSFLLVFAEAVGDLFGCRSPVGNDHAVVFPLIAQYIFQDKGISCRRNTVIIVERRHKGGTSGFRSRFERRKIDVTHLAFGNECRIIIASSFCCSVADKMFGTGCNGGRIVQGIALKTFHHSYTHNGTQVRIFTTAFSDSSPAGIARDIDHRGKCPADTVG